MARHLLPGAAVVANRELLAHRQPNTVIAGNSLNAVMLVKTLRAYPECA